MKKIIILFSLSFMVLFAQAQTAFEGTINYKWKFMGEGVEAYESMLPTGSSLMIKGLDSRFHIEGGMAGMMLGDFLYMGKKGLNYMIKDSESTAYKIKKEEKTEPAEKPVVTKEDEVLTIAGYECQKYTVETETDGQKVKQYLWATEKFVLPKSEGGPMNGPGSVEGVKGAVLKVMVNQGGMTIVMTAEEVSTTVPDKAKFKIPKGYKIADFDPAMLGGMGGM